MGFRPMETISDQSSAATRDETNEKSGGRHWNVEPIAEGAAPIMVTFEMESMGGCQTGGDKVGSLPEVT